MRDCLVSKSRSHAAFLILELEKIVCRRQQSLPRDSERDSARVSSDPTPSPLFRDVGSCARAACWIKYKIAGVRCHQHAALDDLGARLNHISLRSEEHTSELQSLR